MVVCGPKTSTFGLVLSIWGILQLAVTGLLYHYRYANNTICYMQHSSEIRSLSLMKWADEMLQNLPYFWNTNTHVGFFHFLLHYFFRNELVAQNEKQNKKHGFMYSINIANFEAFRWLISSGINFLFLKSQMIWKSEKDAIWGSDTDCLKRLKSIK